MLKWVFLPTLPTVLNVPLFAKDDYSACYLMSTETLSHVQLMEPTDYTQKTNKDPKKCIVLFLHYKERSHISSLLKEEEPVYYMKRAQKYPFDFRDRHFNIS